MVPGSAVIGIRKEGKMKQLFYSICLLTVLLFCVSCADGINGELPVADGKYTMTVTAAKSVLPTKALSLSGSILTAQWAKGEKVTAFNKTKNASLGGELTADSDGAVTVLTGRLSGEISVGDDLTLKFLSPDYTGQDGTIEYISKHCDYAEATVSVKTIDANNNITLSQSNVDFVNKQAIVKFSLKKADGSALEIPASTAVSISDGTNTYTVTPTAAAGVLFVAIPATNTVNISTTVGGIVYSYEKAGAELVAGNYYEIGVKMSRIGVNLAGVTGNITLLNGDRVYGTLGGKYKVSIADKATVTLDGVTINGADSNQSQWAGITCVGDATIVLAGTNTVNSFFYSYPAIFPAEYKTLIIRGEGSLTADGGIYSAGIGSGWGGDCGNIEIQGGTITANGGQNSAGIGGGWLGGCGTITITTGVNKVVAKKGEDASNSIGLGSGDTDDTCGTVTIGGTVFWDGSQYQHGGDTYLSQSTLVYPSLAAFSGGTGTAADPYRISSDDDWLTLASLVNSGETFSGRYFKQTTDLSVTTMVGTDAKAFSGNYDGNGEILHVQLNGSGEYTAPFVYIKNATIQNLVITGSVITTGKRPAGIASFCEDCTITNCVSNVLIRSSYDKEIEAGAIVANVINNKTLTLRGCLFNGVMDYSEGGYKGGGMVGWTETEHNAISLIGCVFAPASINVPQHENSRVFVSGEEFRLFNKYNCFMNATAAGSGLGSVALAKDGSPMYSIKAGEGVTSLAIDGEGTEYNVSRITSYKTPGSYTTSSKYIGIKYNGVYYGATGSVEIPLILSHADAPAGKQFSSYSAGDYGTFKNYTETQNNPVLIMGKNGHYGDVTITAQYY